MFGELRYARARAGAYARIARPCSPSRRRPRHTAALFGGSILLSEDLDDGHRYVRSVEHFADVTSRRGVDVEIQNHPLYDGFGAKLTRLSQRAAGKHPFVVGPDA